jgi:MFS family permease
MFRAPQDITARNIRYLYLEILLASALSAVILNFNSAFAIRLGASKEMIALMTSFPALVAAIFSIPSARFFEGRRNRRLWLFGSLTFIRGSYIMIALLPILFPDRLTAAWFLIIWVIALNLPTIFFTNGWQALLGDVIPEDRRAYVISRRAILWSVGLVIISAVSGGLLDALAGDFPLNYQLLYLFAFLISIWSNYYVSKIVVPERPARPRPTNRAGTDSADDKRSTLEHPIRPSLRLRRMLFNTGIYHIGLTIAAPLFNVYYINQLGATDGWLGLNSAAGNAGVVFGYLLWERALRKRPYEWGIRWATTLTCVFPIGIALFPDFTVITLLNFFVNLMHPGVELSSFNLMLKMADPAHRAVVMSWYNMVINISLFASPLVGTWLAGYPGIGIPGVLIIGGLFRILGNVLYRLNPVDEPKPQVQAQA